MVLLLLNYNLTITNETIVIGYFPILLSKKVIKKHEIDEIKRTKYDAIRDFGGWGVRKNKEYKIAYIAEGFEGIAIRLKNGEKLLPGVPRDSEFSLIEHFN
jgi:hypothetical protein